MLAEDLAAPARRLALVDFARGIAIIAMVAYHATWDLGPDYYGLIAINAAEDPILVVTARLIAGSFLFLVGVSLVLAHRRGLRLRPYLRRLAVIVGAALLITLVTRFAQPETYVRFGILHAIAAASVIGVAFLKAPVWFVLLAAVAAFAAPTVLDASFFNEPALMWVGLSTELLPMIDYVPILPWIGPTLVAIALTRLALAARLDERIAHWQPGSKLERGVLLAGRWSLIIYLIHQPLLLGLIYLIALAAGEAPPALF